MNDAQNDLLSRVNTRMRRIHAVLTDQAIECRDGNGAVTGYTAHLDPDTFRELMNLSDGLNLDVV